MAPNLITDADFLTCTAGHTVDAGSVIDSAQGPRCPVHGCGARCSDDIRAPSQVLSAEDLNRYANLRLPRVRPGDLTWAEIGRRYYLLAMARGEICGGEGFDSTIFFIDIGYIRVMTVIHAEEMAAIRSGYEAEQRRTMDPDPAECTTHFDPSDAQTQPCIECGSADPSHPHVKGCKSCAHSALIADSVAVGADYADMFQEWA
jgi:hypothetical protein